MHQSSRTFPRASRDGCLRGGFTLVEMLVATTVLLLIMGILFSMTQQAATVLKNSNGKIESFQAARAAFETMTRNLSLATLNSYYDYINTAGQTIGQYSAANPTGTFVPSSYRRTSDLHFICGQQGFIWGSGASSSNQVKGTHAIFFQAPLGYSPNSNYQSLSRLLNACGYFIFYGNDSPPGALFPGPARIRYQLMEYIQPSENLTVYNTNWTATTRDTSSASETNWFNSDVANFAAGAGAATITDVHPIADNIVALVFLPEYSSGDASASTPLTTTYNYDTRDTSNTTTLNVLPPVVAVAMVAIDEASAARLAANPTQLAAFQSALGSDFTTSQPTYSASTTQMTTDLNNLQLLLQNDHLNSRVFETEVPLRDSKF